MVKKKGIIHYKYRSGFHQDLLTCGFGCGVVLAFDTPFSNLRIKVQVKHGVYSLLLSKQSEIFRQALSKKKLRSPVQH